MERNSLKSESRIIEALDVLASEFSLELTKPNRQHNNGEGRKGVTRLAYSCDETRAFQWARIRLEELGFKCQEDAALNLHATWKDNSSSKRLLFGSHIDSVRNAGKFDGTVGLIAFLEAFTLMREDGLTPRIPVDFTLFRAEESTIFNRALLGSGLATGAYCISDLGKLAFKMDPQNDDQVAEDYVKRLGLKYEKGSMTLYQILSRHSPTFDTKIDKGCWLFPFPPTRYKGYFEVHIEQGNILFHKNIEIGIVDSFRAPLRREYVVKGRTDHSGATPMTEGARHDALCAAAECILVIERICTEAANACTDIVGTVGWIDVPNKSINRVPGECRFRLDLRSNHLNSRDQVIAQIQKSIDTIATNRDITIEFDELEVSNPILLESEACKELAKLAENAANRLNLTHMPMASGAGHDAMSLARSGVATCMLFIPCEEGISHSPEENAEPSSIRKAAELIVELVCSCVH